MLPITPIIGRLHFTAQSARCVTLRNKVFVALLSHPHAFVFAAAITIMRSNDSSPGAVPIRSPTNGVSDPAEIRACAVESASIQVKQFIPEHW